MRQYWCPEPVPKTHGTRTVVKVCMGNQDGNDPCAGRQRRDQCIEMRRIVRARIDDHHFLIAKNITARAGEGHWTGIWCRHHAQVGPQPFDSTDGGRMIAVKGIGRHGNILAWPDRAA